MTANSLEVLLDRLCRGDDAAADAAFRTYEPYLRMVVRRMLPRQLRSKFGSSDVVQSVWANVLHGFRDAGWRFRDAEHLRRFLVTVTRNAFLDRVRKFNPMAEREQKLDTPVAFAELTGHEAQPADVAAANELWDQILALCSPMHREVVELRLQGLTIVEIATKLGLHEGSVRRILTELAHNLAEEQCRFSGA